MCVYSLLWNVKWYHNSTSVEYLQNEKKEEYRRTIIWLLSRFSIPIVQISSTLFELWGTLLPWGSQHIPLLISWSVKQGEKTRMKNQPATRQKESSQTPLSHGAVSFSPSPPLIRSLLPPAFLQSLLHVRDWFFWSPACNTRPWAHLAIYVPWGACTVKLSQGRPASYPPSTRCHSMMLIWRKFIHYVMLSLIIYPPLSFH